MSSSESGPTAVSCDTAAQSVSTSVWTADGRLEATSAGWKADLAVHMSGRCSLGAAVPCDGEPSESQPHNHHAAHSELNVFLLPGSLAAGMLVHPAAVRRTVRTQLFVSSSGREGWETLDALVSVCFRETS